MERHKNKWVKKEDMPVVKSPEIERMGEFCLFVCLFVCLLDQVRGYVRHQIPRN